MFDSRIQSCEGGFLRYACVESAEGRLLVLMSDLGVVDVIRGDSKTEMLSCAARRFPTAGFVPIGAFTPFGLLRLSLELRCPRSGWSFP